MTPPSTLSPASQLAMLDFEERQAFLGELKPEELAALEYDWTHFWARPAQLPRLGDLEGVAHPGGPGLWQESCRG